MSAKQFTYVATDNENLTAAVIHGAGIGFLSDHDAVGRDDLVEVIAQREDWGAPLWLVTHVDLHRTSKVQAVLAHLKAAAKAHGA